MKQNASSSKGEFRILEFTNPSQAIAFRVSGWTLDGRRIRENFKTHGEAVTRQQELEIQAANLSDAARPVITRLTTEQTGEAERAFAELNGAPLLKAVRFYLANYREPIREIPVADAFEQFLADKARQNCRPDTITNLRRKCALLMVHHGKQNVSEIVPDAAKQIIFRPGLSPVSQDNVRRALGCFFNWALKQGFCKASPLANVEAVRIERDEPGVLPLADVRKLLSEAVTLKEGRVLPFLAISLFAGIRPKEIARLTWADVNLDSKTITITGKAAKLRERRLVEMSVNLVEWLRPHSIAKLPFVGPNWRRDFDAVKEAAGFGGRKLKDENGEPLRPWTADILRHTAISYHLAKHEHEGKAALWAGNSPNVIQRHYRGLVSKQDANLFWKIAPDSKQSALTDEKKGRAAA